MKESKLEKLALDQILFLQGTSLQVYERTAAVLMAYRTHVELANSLGYRALAGRLVADAKPWLRQAQQMQRELGELVSFFTPAETAYPAVSQNAPSRSRSSSRAIAGNDTVSYRDVMKMLSLTGIKLNELMAAGKLASPHKNLISAKSLDALIASLGGRQVFVLRQIYGSLNSQPFPTIYARFSARKNDLLKQGLLHESDGIISYRPEDLPIILKILGERGKSGRRRVYGKKDAEYVSLYQIVDEAKKEGTVVTLAQVVRALSQLNLNYEAQERMIEGVPVTVIPADARKKVVDHLLKNSN